MQQQSLTIQFHSSPKYFQVPARSVPGQPAQFRGQNPDSIPLLAPVSRAPGQEREEVQHHQSRSMGLTYPGASHLSTAALGLLVCLFLVCSNVFSPDPLEAGGRGLRRAALWG